MIAVTSKQAARASSEEEKMKIELWIDVPQWTTADGRFAFAVQDFPPSGPVIEGDKRYHGFVQVPDPIDMNGEYVDLVLEAGDDG